MDKSGGCQDIAVGNLLSLSAEVFRKESFNGSSISGFEKIQGYEKGATNTTFRQSCFVSQYRNIRQGNFSVCY